MGRIGIGEDRYMLVVLGAVVAFACGSVCADGAGGTLVGRAVLPADTMSDGPTEGTCLGSDLINGVMVPFRNRQPVQGFSAILDAGRNSYWAMTDNGFGSIENSADHLLRVYRIRPRFLTAVRDDARAGGIEVLGFIELSDPDRHVEFAITNGFTPDRKLTGADFDIESFQIAPDGTIWFGDEFGPFLLHTDATGRLLEPPIALPDVDRPGQEIRSPQNPYNEEASTIRVMNAMWTDAQRHGAARRPVCSPSHEMLADDDPSTFVNDRRHPPAGSDLAPASSEVHDVESLQRAGYAVVAYTVDDAPRMAQLLALGVNGIITDRPDLLYATIAAFDADADGAPGDYLLADGRIDTTRVDAQGHRGGRNLRPESTLPAMEVALDHLMTTLEIDCGVTRDGVPVLGHDAYLRADKCRRADGAPYAEKDEVLIKDLSAAEIQAMFIGDGLLPGCPEQTNDRARSPVAVAVASEKRLADPYTVPTLKQLFAFVDYYVDYYANGPGAGEPNAAVRARNASHVRFNIETKTNPRTDTDAKGNVFADRTVGHRAFVEAVLAYVPAGMEARVDIQSFDWRTLRVVHEKRPGIRTVYLFGDGAADGANLQGDNGENTPWLAGLDWPYRSTVRSAPFRAHKSGGFEGMALTTDGRTLLPLLEKPLEEAGAGELLMHAFDLGSKRYSGDRYVYQMEPAAKAIGDFIMHAPDRGLVIERDDTQGDLDGFKRIYEIRLRGVNERVTKGLAVDLLRIDDPNGLSTVGARRGDVGLGPVFAFPFWTIEDVIVLDENTIGVLNDNNYPFSVGRHVGSQAPDDTEFIRVNLDRRLGEIAP